MEIVIITALICIFISMVIDVANNQISLKGIFSPIFLIILIIVYINSPEPIDVYRGKTTLEISYRDSIPVDSTVIFKK